jgi:nucleotide-binding universal stress UspA family protein
MKKHETMTKMTPGTGMGSGIANRRKARQSKSRNATPGTILVPVDFSAGSLRALDLADSLANQFNAVLVLVHVLDPIYTAGRLDSPRLRAHRAEARQEAELKLGRLAQISTRESERPRKHHVIDGVAPDAILTFAKKAKADWIVMGSKGQTGVKRLLAGSVAERVVRHATCPVLVAP